MDDLHSTERPDPPTMQPKEAKMPDKGPGSKGGGKKPKGGKAAAAGKKK